ncbi:hypothetical protein [Parendozoicomonas sp. Alg238-R29]|uniref:hypothetical protein n=1 Tax=Parendozoicomonas sp. Alg238-R29 TaxID=2993446 RepID=UPI00248E7070|nr:hypothetical protein [Parendozoicomonas sp. Alg238-R29]
MPVIDGPTAGGEPQRGRNHRKVAVGSYRRRKVVRAHMSKRMGYKMPKLTPAERKDRRRARRLQKQAEVQAEKAVRAEAIKAAKAEMRKDYGDPFIVVLELARIADKMKPEDYSDQVEYIKAVSSINTLITIQLKEIEKSQERDAERKQEEHDQDRQDQKSYNERRQLEEAKRVKALEDINKANELREQWLKQLPPAAGG